jgi:hypothetical protein
MGRFIKNTEIRTSGNAVRMPVVEAAAGQGTQFPVDGLVRYNKSSGFIEYYTNNKWQPVGAAGRVEIVKDAYIGTGSQLTYPITNAYDPGHEQEMLVFVGNIYQNPGVAYTVNGYFLTFTSAPDLDMPVLILHNFNSTKVQ